MGADLRRELLDRTLIWNQHHLLHALRGFERFYNEHRPHQGLASARPDQGLEPDRHAPTLIEAMETIRTKAFVILDGTLLPIDRMAAVTPYYSGKHKRHGMNVQVLTDLFGRLLWASPALPGATQRLTAARSHGIIDALATAGLKCWADKAYQGAGPLVRVPFRGRRLKGWRRRHNGTHAKIRCLGEQAMATLKGWRLLRKLRCSTNRITDIVKAVLVLHNAST